MKKCLLFCSLFLSLGMSLGLKAQIILPGESLVYGPMFSPVYQNKVRVWVLTKDNTPGTGDKLSLSLTASGAPSLELTGTVFNSDDRLGHHLRSFEFSNLAEAETYTAKLLVNGVASSRTAIIVNGQKVINDFTFLAGGCGRIYDTSRCIDIPESKFHFNGDPAIFDHMALEKSDLMVWLGDAVYLLGLEHAAGQCPGGVDDWANKDMAFDRYKFYRKFHDKLTMAMPQLAITDNHDTGSNEFNKTMPTLGETREIFKDWWPNPEYLNTPEGSGLYSSYVYKDVEFFLTDNRSYRDGTTQHFGPDQLAWLKNALLNSKATFKVVINGTPSFYNGLGGRNFCSTAQSTDLRKFIQDNNIDGVLSYSADIHSQGFMSREGDVKYPLYDILSGNINSDVENGEIGNISVDYNSASNNILSGNKHAYVRTSVLGPVGDRRMKIEYIGFDGKTFFEENIHQDMLSSQNATALKLSLDFTGNVADASGLAHKVNAQNSTFGTDRDGNAHQALVFSNTTSVSIPASNTLSFNDKSYTLSFWIKPTAFTAGGSTIISNATASAGTAFGVSASGNLTYKDFATGNTITSNYSVLANKWSNITWKYDNVRRKLSLYCDGALKQSWNGITTSTASNADTKLGDKFTGALDGVNLHARLMSDADILNQGALIVKAPVRGKQLSLNDGHNFGIHYTPVEIIMGGAHTIEFWLNLQKPITTTNKTVLSNHGRIGGLSKGFTVELGTDGAVSATYGNNLTSGWITAKSTAKVKQGEWNHIAVTTVPGGQVKIYINGALSGSTNFVQYHPNQTWDFKFGNSTAYPISNFNMLLDEFRMWSTARTQAEIVADMHNTIIDAKENLAFNYTFDQDNTGVLVNSGTDVSTTPYSNASFVNMGSPAATPVPGFDKTITANWNVATEKGNGIYVTDAITAVDKNVIFGKSAQNNTIIKLPNAAAPTNYAVAGWLVNPSNITAPVKVSIDLSTVFANVNAVNSIAANYKLIKGDPQVTYEVAATASAVNGIVTFDNVTLAGEAYYLAYEVDKVKAIAAQGGALELAGTHQVKIPRANIESVLAGDVTIELWAKVNKNFTDKTILSNHGRVNNLTTGFTLELAADGSPNALFGNNTGWVTAASGTKLTLGEWNHIAITASPTSKQLKIYVNGELKATTAFVKYFANNTWDFGLGRSFNYNTFSNTVMDEFRVWNKVKTQDEIKADMYKTITAADTNLKYNYTFNQLDNGTLVNAGNVADVVTYTNAAILPATAPVRTLTAPFDNAVAADWSVLNDTKNGLYLADKITDFDTNIVVSKETGTDILPVLGSNASGVSYLNARWKIDPLTVTSGNIRLDVSKVFANLNSVELLGSEYYLLTGDPATAKNIVATGNKVNNIVTFNNVSFNGTPVYLAWKKIVEYPIGTLPIAAGSLWKYNDQGVDLGTDWKNSDFNDSSWAFGNAILGYGDGVESTTLNFGGDTANKYPTYYLRNTFNVDDVSKIGGLIFNTTKDDGIVVYVNGTEAYRSNMPDGNITYITYASSAIDGANENLWTEVFTPNLLKAGENVIAVELHQSSANSSDARFDMSVSFVEPELAVSNYPLTKDQNWYYSDKGTDLVTNWSAANYNAIRWDRGRAPFGYGDPVNTVISYGSNASAKYITSYFAKDINVSLNQLTNNVELGLRRDDGAVVYINGVEVLRSNMPAGTIGYNTPASSNTEGIDENIYYTSILPKSYFVEGKNRISVEVHQNTASSSDVRFDMYIKNTKDLSVDCTDKNIGCFTSIAPTAQTNNLIIADDYDFQLIQKEGESYKTGTGTMPGNNDYTAYVAKTGSSKEGYLSINHENNPGGVSMLDVKFNETTKFWEVNNSRAVDFSNSKLVKTARNCSGGITPWGTVVTTEESTDAGDVNGDGYQDLGWFVEIDPATASVKDYGNGQEKLWALGRMNHENIVITDDKTTAYYGEDGGTHCVYKYVMNTPGDLTSGKVYVLSLDLALSGNDDSSSTGKWIQVPNDTKSDRNNLATVASSIGGTSFNGIEDIEINPLTGQIYFAAKGFNRVYRLTDNGSTISDFETVVGGRSYAVTTKNGIQTEPWADGNDNLTFDPQGNLWVLQDGGKNYIWVIRPDHTQSNPNVMLFASMPAGSEPTGLTFTPDHKYGFFSIQHPSTSNASQKDITGKDIVFNASATIVFALKGDLGSTLGIDDKGEARNITLYPNPTGGIVNVEFGNSYLGQPVTIEVYDILGRQLKVYNAPEATDNKVSLDLSNLKGNNQVLLLTVKINQQTRQFKVLVK